MTLPEPIKYHASAKWLNQLSARIAPLLDTSATVYIKSPNSVLLEFVEADDLPPRPRIRDAGLRYIAFAGDNLESAKEQLASRDVEFEGSYISLPAGARLFVRDPEGNDLHLVQWETPLL